MDVVRTDVVVKLRRHRVRLGDLLRLETRALEHVQEVRVPTDVELAGPLELDSPLPKEPGQHAVHDGRADLRLDVVSHDRQALLLEALLPVGLTRDEDRDTVDETAPGLEDLLDVPLGRLFAADGQEADHDVGSGVLEELDDVVGRTGRLLDDLGEVLPQAVVRHAPRHAHPEIRHVAELVGVVRLREDGLGDVPPHLVLVDVDRGRELDVTDVVTAEIDVHESRHERIGRRVLVVLHSLHKGGRAVPQSDDRYSDLVLLSHERYPRVLRGVAADGQSLVAPRT